MYFSFLQDPTAQTNWLYFLSTFLQAARDALAVAHGPNMEKVRRIHGTGFCPEIATYVRVGMCVRVYVCVTDLLQDPHAVMLLKSMGYGTINHSCVAYALHDSFMS